MKPLLLVLSPLSREQRHLIAERFELIEAPTAALGADRSSAAARIAERGAEVRVVLTIGTTGLTADEIAALPKLELVCTAGVGYENVAVDAARARSIPVCNAAGVNDDTVADHAMALLLSAVRRVPFLNDGVRRGLWRDGLPRPPQLAGRRLGVFGLGAIGRKVARRALGFDVEVGYHSRTRRDDSGHRWFDDILSLAEWADFLVLAAPGGAATRHVVDRRVLEALGPDGVLVNIARGSLVDTQALADALREKRLGAAALDVYESEPAPPAALLEFDNAVLTPHVAGLSPQTERASALRFLDTAERHFAGQPLPTRVN